MGAHAAAPPIDTAFDFRIDTPPGEDPDTHSPTLRRYHQFLWSKPLPDGTPFDLTTEHLGRYLQHSSALGDFALSSDSVIPSYRTWQRMAHITSQVPAALLDEFQAVGYSIGGMMVFPAYRRPGTLTINQARGTLAAIGDRMDLTLDCIRAHYAGGTSPLAPTLANYAGFFALFVSLDGYVRFFDLENLIGGRTLRHRHHPGRCPHRLPAPPLGMGREPAAGKCGRVPRL